MNTKRWIKGLVVVLGLLVAPTAQAQPASTPVTTGMLVREMTDLERLTRFPAPAYKTVQFSSYDRRNDQPGGPDWYANSDGFGGEPIPNVEEVLEKAGEDGVGTYLLCDVEGPGAMVRTWTAAINGTVRLYLDGAETPLYDGPADRFMRKAWYASLEGVDVDSSLFEGTFIQRDAGYFPVPFAERLRVEWTGNLKQLHFYELQTRLYEPGTAVETFTPEDLRTYQSALEEAAAALTDPDEAYAADGSEARDLSVTIPAGERRELLRLRGPQAIRQLTLQVEGDDLDRALRQSVLHIAFDGQPWPQVQALVGDHPETRLEEGALWAGGQLFVWAPEEAGDSLQVPLPVSEGGSYRLYLTVAKDDASGTFSCVLNGERLQLRSYVVGESEAERVSLYTPHHQVLRTYQANAGPFELEAGEHELNLQYEGHEEGGGNDLGIDFIWLQRVSS